MYDFNDVGNKKSRKFRTESHVFTARFKRFEDLPPHQLDALFLDVTQQIKQKLNAEPSDMIRLSINHPSLDMGIHIPFMCADQLEGTVLLDQMEKVLQSNTEFKLNDGLFRWILHIRNLQVGVEKNICRQNWIQRFLLRKNDRLSKLTILRTIYALQERSL